MRTMGVVCALLLLATAGNGSADPWQRIDRPGMRFYVTMSGRAVLDRETDLIWVREPFSPVFNSLGSVQVICASLFLGGRHGWRVPLVHELMSLVDPATPDGLPPGHPFLNITSDPFFTGTFVSGTNNIFTKVLNGFGVNQQPAAAAAARLWCVRGAGVSMESD